MTKLDSDIISISRAGPDDLSDVFLWRNDPVSRQQSLNSQLISWREHKDWFEKVLGSEECCLLMCFSESLQTKIGVVRFDIVGNQATVSINLEPTVRGLGLGTRCLSKAIDYFCCRFLSINCLKAMIVTSNKASRVVFKKIGFECVVSNDGVDEFCLSINRLDY